MTTAGTSRLSDVARHVVQPEGIVGTGWPKVRDTCARLGWGFDPWQDGAGRLILAKRSDGLYAADTIVMSIPRQVGKALDVSTPMLTANRGWVTMGQLRPGDQVFGVDGHPTTVAGVSPIMHGRVCYRVTTTDGRSVVADAEHLWTVTDRCKERSVGPLHSRTRWHEQVQLTTQQMFDAGPLRAIRANGRNEFRFQLPQQLPLQSPDVDLPIDPYILGAWLGDGTSVNGSLACHVDDASHWVEQGTRAGYDVLVRDQRTAKRLVFSHKRRQSASLAAQLRRLGLRGNKHVPEAYLVAGVKQREALLQGLMDTDGYVDKRGAVEFCSTSRLLADAVLYLARSLGWRAVLREGVARLQGRVCGPKYRVTWKPKGFDPYVPFRLERKLVRISSVSDTAGRHTVSIASIEPVESVPVRCIAVDAPDQLYLAGRDLIVTHNTYLVACIIFALCLIKPGLTVIWTAHHKATAAETFGSFEGMARRPKVAVHITTVTRGKGDEKVLFKNGSRILFGARESGFGRGFSDVDVIVWDEAQILNEATMEDMAASQNVAANPLTFMMGTPPRPKDPGEMFTLMRQESLDGDSVDSLYIELSADRGCDPMDRAQWRKANPSFPARTTERAMLRLRKKLKSEDSWNREALGIWDEVSKHQPVIKDTFWSTLEDVGPDDGTKPGALGVDMSHDRLISVGACWVEEHSAHIEEVFAHDDANATMNWIVERAGRRTPVLIDGMGPASSLIADLRARGVNVTQTTAGDMAKACGMFEDRAKARLLTHDNNERVNDALKGARKRLIRDAGGWGWDRRDPTAAIYPIVAVTLALYGAVSHGPKRRSSGGRTAIVM